MTPLLTFHPGACSETLGGGGGGSPFGGVPHAVVAQVEPQPLQLRRLLQGRQRGGAEIPNHVAARPLSAGGESTVQSQQ